MRVRAWTDVAVRWCLPGLLVCSPAWSQTAAPPRAAVPFDAVVRSEHRYALPALRLQRADGRRLTLTEALADGRPVVMTFMYDSCATVCPITNQTLVAFEQALGPDLARVNAVSISIDPDHDSVRRLAEHAARTGARGSFFTGDPASSEAVQRAFDAWRGDKANHQPVFLLSADPLRQWVRLDGLVLPDRLMAEFRRLRRTGPELRRFVPVLTRSPRCHPPTAPRPRAAARFSQALSNPLDGVGANGVNAFYRTDPIGPVRFNIQIHQVRQDVLGVPGKATTVWGDKNWETAQATYPGRTFQVRRNVPTLVSWQNNLRTPAGPLPHILPVDQSITLQTPTTGVPVVVHHHGGDTAPEFDGGPDQ